MADDEMYASELDSWDAWDGASGNSDPDIPPDMDPIYYQWLCRVNG